MPLVEEIGSVSKPLNPDNVMDNPQLPSEVSEAMAEMEGWRQSNPAAFEAIMKATMESKAAGDDEETSMKKIEAALKIQQQAEVETLMAAQQASQIANEGIQLPGQSGRKVGLDGQVKQTNIAGLDITPTPSFVVKTKGIYQMIKTKIFINICSHKALTEPHMKKRLNEQGEEVEGWNIPLAIGPQRDCIDHKGNQCKVYDCVVNSEVIIGIESDDTGSEKDFLIQLAIQYVEQKYQCELDRRYKLPKMIYKSSNVNDPKEIASQRIKDASKQPTISEVSSSKTNSKKNEKNNKKNDQLNHKKKSKNIIPLQLKKLKSSLWLIQSDGCEIEDKTRATTDDVVNSIEPEKEPNVRYNNMDDSHKLPRYVLLKIGPLSSHAINALNDKNDKNQTGTELVNIDVSCYDVKVKLPGHSELHVVFPYAIADDEVECIFSPNDNNTQILQIKCPIDPTPYDILHSDPGSRPWLLAQALEGGGDGRNEIEMKQFQEAEMKYKNDQMKANSLDEAETKFHLRANKFKQNNHNGSGFDPITGLICREEDPVNEDEELPEDKFHKDDALSSHYINQREGDKDEKWKKHEKEKKEREARKASGETNGVDENVEYIDVEDFSPGGKYGPPAIDVGARRDELTGVKYSPSEDMRKAANVVISAASKNISTSSSNDSSNDSICLMDTKQSNNQANDSESGTGVVKGLSQKRLMELKSTVWADLLD